MGCSSHQQGPDNSPAAWSRACWCWPGELLPCTSSRHYQANDDKPSVLQTLNVSMYNAIGKKGVYYGEKLGSKVPWCTSLPFSVVSHPQYVGSVLSIWGVFALVYAQGPATLWTVATYWTGLYFVTGLIEQFL